MKCALLLSLILAAVNVSSAQEQPRERHRFPHESPPLAREQQAELEKRLDGMWQAMPLHEKLQLMRFHRALSQMDPEERNFVHDRFERFMHMNERERQQLKANRERWRNMSPEEKEEARQAYGRRREEFEHRWREAHPGEGPPPARWPGHDAFPPSPGGEMPVPIPSKPNPPTTEEKP